jgi:hypothetical protein
MTIKAMWLADAVLVVHGLVVGVTVAGGVAIFTGRFAKFHARDVFAWSFLACCAGQLASLLLTGGCILTQWERQLRHQADPSARFSQTFLQHYLPFLPNWFTATVPLLTLAAAVGAALQAYSAWRRRAPLRRDDP